MYFILTFKKKLATPKLTVGRQLYLRLLWTYVFGIYSASTNVMIAYVRIYGMNYCPREAKMMWHHVYHIPFRNTSRKDKGKVEYVVVRYVTALTRKRIM